MLLAHVCRVLRTLFDCYVVMMTACRDEIDKLVGLSVGRTST